MNERIKELLLQNKDDFSYSVTSVDGKVYIHGSEDNLEKFAELIVKECIKAIDDGDGSLSSVAEHSWREICASEIKQHFGVE